MNEKTRAILADPLRVGLTLNARGKGLTALCAAVCVAFFAALTVLCAGMEGQVLIALVSAACLAVLLWSAYAALGDGESVMTWLCIALLGAMAIGAHITLLSVRPGRYSAVIAPMLSEMWNYDFLAACAWEDGSWSGVYLFVCALVSRLEGFPQMTLLKLFDMACQCLCGAAVLRLALARGAKAPGAIAGMMACVLAPTMLMNAGVWLQCDATFAMFALWGLYLILSGRPMPGCVLWGLALGTKLQSAFLFPLLIPLFMREKLSLRHLLALALAYVLSQGAFLLDQQGIANLVNRYYLQIDEMKWGVGLSDHAPGVFGLMIVASVREFSGMGLYFAIACGLLTAFALLRAKGTLSADAWLLAAWLLAAGLPLVLPQVNARMLYLAGMLGFALAGNARRMLACGLLELISLCGYIAGIFATDVMPIIVLSLLAIGAALLILMELLAALSPAKEEGAHA